MLTHCETELLNKIILFSISRYYLRFRNVISYSFKLEIISYVTYD